MALSQSDQELLTEHFGYAPVALLDEIINSVNTISGNILEGIENGLGQATPKTLGFEKSLKKLQQQRQRASASSSSAAEPLPSAQQMADSEIAPGMQSLETLLFSSIDKYFDIFELYVVKYIVRLGPESSPWIRLRHYAGLDFDAAASDRGDTPTEESVNAVRRSLQGSRRLNAMLHAEKARNEALLAKLRSVIGDKGAATGASGRDNIKTEEGAEGERSVDKPPFAFLARRGDLTDADARTPIATTTDFTLSQLQALRALSTSLRNILPDLAVMGDADDADEGRKGWRRERMEYVEGQTRKHLENVRGLELGKSGEVRDGEWQGEGRKFATGEVERLEKVASLLNGGSVDMERSSNQDVMDES